MNRLKMYLLIDTVALAAFLSMGATGIILRFILPPGSGRQGLTLLGLSRHEWGDIHFYAAAFFLAVVFIHLVVHWKWILCALKTLKTRPSAKDPAC